VTPASAAVEDPERQSSPAPAPRSTETVAFARPSHLGGAEIMTVANSQRLWRVYHETYTVCAVFDVARGGGAEWAYRGQLHAASAGSLMLMEPGELHATRSVSAPGTFSVLLVPPATLDDLGAESGLRTPPHFRTAEARDPSLFGAFVRFHQAVRGDASILEQQSRFAGCLRQLIERHGEGPAPRRPASAATAVARARIFLSDAYPEAVDLATLARVAGVSPFYLCRMFSEVVGVPPHAYLARVRVARAGELLRQGAPAAQVATQVGFADQSHLTRWFRKVLGITPAQYAASCRTRRLAER